MTAPSNGKASIKPQVFLAMPAYGLVHVEAMNQFFGATTGDVDIVGGQVFNSSLLPMTFNLALAEALAARDRGKATHFAMLHSDIAPDRGWLDTLWAEMQAHGADLISAVVPIKAGDDKTSTAYGSTIDPWTATRYVLRSARPSMPTTFGQETAGSGEVLLVNTGCWLADLRRPWWDGFAFQLLGRITKDAGGYYHAQCRPEDWEMSRHLYAAGAKVMATWAVPLLHYGTVAWTSHVELADPPPADAPEDSGQFRFPDDVDGWLAPAEGRALFDLARDKMVLEIGSYCGKSTLCLAQSARFVVAVDPHDGRATPKPRDTFAEMEINLERWGLSGKVGVQIGTIAAAPCGPFDLAFIDGAHDYEAVQADIAGCMKRLAPGGLLAFHDYREHAGQYDDRCDPGVTQSVHELIAAGGELVATYGTIAVVKPPAQVPVGA